MRLATFSRIVGFAGVAGAGKNAIATALNLPQASFAQALKDDLLPIFSRLGLNMGHRGDKELARPMLVEYGRLARKADPDFWIKRIAIPPNHDIVAITDVRYLNEAQAIINTGGIVIYINRPGWVPANAEEDKSLAEVRAMGGLFFVDNDRTIEAMADGVRPIIEAYKVHPRCATGSCGCD